MAGGCGGRGQSLFRWWGERLSVDAGHGHAVHWQWLKDNGVDVDGLATMAAAGGISDAGNAVAGSLADGRVRSAEWQARRYHCRNWRRRLREWSAIPTPPSGPFSIGCKSTLCPDLKHPFKPPHSHSKCVSLQSGRSRWQAMPDPKKAFQALKKASSPAPVPSLC